MIDKIIDQINEKDLQDLIDNVVREGKRIEYKKSLPTDSVPTKKEFLADVSSFANASGGDLIYGITESRGIPQKLEGLDIEDVDQEILRLDNIIRAGIEPRLLSVSIQPIELPDSKTILIIRVRKSWISPHRVIYEGHGHGKFYSRSSNGKYPLDVAELRVAFNLSETTTERVRNFRQDRISNILADETPVPLYDNAKILLHIIPITSFEPAKSYDISKIASQPNEMKPIYCYGWNNRYNLDGFLTYCADSEGKSYSYVQLFRNGIIEAVEARLLEPWEENLLIPSTEYERELISSLNNYLSLLETLEVELPIFIFLTLLKVKGYSMGIDRADRYPSIDRDILLLPEIVIEDYHTSAANVLRPCFDSIWNACGLSRSFNYDENGEWKSG